LDVQPTEEALEETLTELKETTKDISTHILFGRYERLFDLSRERLEEGNK